jgi:hypothetical protein
LTGDPTIEEQHTQEAGQEAGRNWRLRDEIVNQREVIPKAGIQPE